MKKQLTDHFQHMLLFTPDAEKVEAYQHLIPGTHVYSFDPEQNTTDNARLLAQHIVAHHTRILLLINRPPLAPELLVPALRTALNGRDIYIMLVTPHAATQPLQTRLDIDDYIFLTDSDLNEQMLELAVNHYLRTIEMRNRFTSATRTALTAMDAAAEYGALIHFFDASEKCHTLDALADNIVEYLAAKNLDALFCIDTPDQAIRRPATSITSAREYLLKQLKQSSKRVVTADKLLGYRFGHFTLLVFNSPVEQPEKHGQIKDSLAHFSEIVETCIRHIMIRDNITHQHGHVLEIMKLIRNITDGANQRTKAIMRGLVQDIEVAATTYDMNLEEEQKLLGIAHHAADQLDKLHVNNQVIENHFLSLIDTLTSVINLVTPKTESSTPPATDGIELF